MNNKDIATALMRLDLYLLRVKRAIQENRLGDALADCAELAEIARRLWIGLETRIMSKNKNI